MSGQSFLLNRSGELPQARAAAEEQGTLAGRLLGEVETLRQARAALDEALVSTTEAFYDKATKLSDAEDLMATLDESLGCLDPLLTQAAEAAAAEKSARGWLEANLRSERVEVIVVYRLQIASPIRLEDARMNCALSCRARFRRMSAD